ncbi:hypothetical protein MCOR34_010205 [Pyricularia oryzae]|nr:hypothetical protein MCOR34_010205 [Pyricularia oryzae]KAI6463454.1 hypothetical protein MCOR17_005628 [Pyricularia oryzae]KAI6571197.1 hypothetical protein MCOR04_007890 [Pyricularia oryzae]
MQFKQTILCAIAFAGAAFAATIPADAGAAPLVLRDFILTCPPGCQQKSGGCLCPAK